MVVMTGNEERGPLEQRLGSDLAQPNPITQNSSSSIKTDDCYPPVFADQRRMMIAVYYLPLATPSEMIIW